MKESIQFAVGLSVVALCTPLLAQTYTVDFENSQINDVDLGFNTGTVGDGEPFTIVAGDANGNPGNWNLEGSNGPQLLGFWGDWASHNQGYSGPGTSDYTYIDFTLPNTATPASVDVSFDVLVSDGFYPESILNFYGFLDGNQVAEDTLDLSPVTIDGDSEYEAVVNFTGVDEILFNSNAPGGMDNFVYTINSVPEPSTLAMSAVGGLVAVWQFRRRRA